MTPAYQDALTELYLGDAVSKQATTMRVAQPKDWLYIDALRKKEGDALGFIPRDAYLSVLHRVPVDGRRRWEYQDLMLTEDNGDLTGYCYTSYLFPMAHIFQIVVQEDARRWHRALLMLNHVEHKATERGLQGVSCRVAADLESNEFWKAMGYEPIRFVTSTWLNQHDSKSKRELIHYQKRFTPLFAVVQQ